MWQENKILSKRNFSWVIPGKLAGCSLPYSMDDLKDLYGKGVRCLVSLQCGAILPSCSKIGMDWSYFPVEDFSLPSDDKKFDGLVLDIIDSIMHERPVCVHCRAGIGRTGMVLASVVGRMLGLKGEHAIAYVKRNRDAIDTEEQAEYVRKYLSK